MSAEGVPRVGCGGVILRDGRVLLGKRRRAPEAGFWGLFGGKVDWLETIQAAVEREIKEETGLDVRATRLLCVVDHLESEPPAHWVAPVYIAEVLSGDPAICEPETIDEIGWFEPADLPSPLTQAAVAALSELPDFRTSIRARI